MHVRQGSSQIELLAPAKVNLFLEVLSRRADGFHEIETLMVPIDLCDTVAVAPSDDARIQLDCRWSAGIAARRAAESADGGSQWPTLPQGDQNLVVRVLKLFQQRAGAAQGARVRLVKRIPAAAGLGGASSDAAAALVAANRVWDVGWSREQLAELGSECGSDIPFFVHGTAGLCRGRGERIQPLYGLMKLHLVIVRPPAGLATADVYRQCRPAAQPRSVAPLVDAARHGRPALVGRWLFNRLQEAAIEVAPWMGRLPAMFDRLGCWGHQMSGSGSSYFGICRHGRHARSVAGRLRAAGMGAVFSATTRFSATTSAAAVRHE
jgi:4-diphosphocytidyl-2-C-methyl-D-erythritol kinase